MGAVVSSSHIVSAALPLLPPQEEDSSPSSPAPVWGLSHMRQFCTTFSKVNPSHRLQLFTNCSSVGPPQGHKSCQQTCSSVGFPRGHSLLQAPPPAHGLQVNICSTVDLHGLQGDSLPHHGLLHGLQGISVLLPGPPPPPCSLLTLVSAALFLSRVLTPLFHCSFCCAGLLFFPLLKYVLTEVLLPLLMGSS